MLLLLLLLLLLLQLPLPLPLLLHLYCMVLQTIYSLVSFRLRTKMPTLKPMSD